MGGRLSRQRKAPASPNQPAAEPESVSLQLTVAADGGSVAVALVPEEAPPARPTPCPSVPEEDLLIRVQLQESISPDQAIHLVLVQTDILAQGSELGHEVREWMGTPRACAQEVAELAAAQEAEAQWPRSPVARLKAKLSPPHKPRSPKSIAKKKD